MKKKSDAKHDKRGRSRWGGMVVWAWLAVIGMMIGEAWVANSQATNGQQIAELQDEQSRLSIQVSQLERQVATAGSLQTVTQRAADQLGLAPITTNILYLDLPESEESHD